MGNRKFIYFICVMIVMPMFFLSKPTTVDACSCAPPPDIQNEMVRKTAIFSGKVLSIKEPIKGLTWSSADPVQIKFEVKRVWKGDLNTEAVVYTARSSASCGYNGFSVHKEFIVFAYGDSDKLETGICERTKLLDSAEEELAVLGVGYPPIETTKAEESGVTPQASITIASTVLCLITVGLVMWKRKRRH